jgi:hypothetical protein
VKIADLELSIHTERSVAQSTDFHIPETVNWTSPEVLQFGKSAVSAKSDIYALSMVFYEILCCTVPFEEFFVQAKKDEVKRVRKGEKKSKSKMPGALLVNTTGNNGQHRRKESFSSLFSDSQSSSRNGSEIDHNNHQHLYDLFASPSPEPQRTESINLLSLEEPEINPLLPPISAISTLNFGNRSPRGRKRPLLVDVTRADWLKMDNGKVRSPSETAVLADFIHSVCEFNFRPRLIGPFIDCHYAQGLIQLITNMWNSQPQLRPGIDEVVQRLRKMWKEWESEELGNSSSGDTNAVEFTVNPISALHRAPSFSPSNESSKIHADRQISLGSQFVSKQ